MIRTVAVFRVTRVSINQYPQAVVQRSRLILGLLVTFGAAQPVVAQSPSAEAPLRQLNFDLTFAGLDVGFATRTSGRQSIGASLGIGGNWWNNMVVGGSHFAESGGLSYETKDGFTSKELLEVLRASVFMRRELNGGRRVDVGLKASAFAHFDSSDDEPGGGYFVGANVTAMWLKWRKLRLGSELDVGRYAEHGSEFGVNVAPVLLRITFP